MSRVTVIIPVLNGMPFLPEALASLEAQTFRDFEVVLWDNGSTDGTVEEARKWIPARLTGKVVSGQALPLHECLARMVETAETELIARMDADDFCLPDRFALQVALLEESPDIEIVGGQCCFIDAESNLMPLTESLPLSHEDIMTQMMFRSAITHPALMFRRDAILKAGNYCCPKPVEDLDLYMRMSCSGRFCNLPETVLQYRIHDQSICQTSREEQAYLAIETVAFYSERVYGLDEATYRKLRAGASGCSIIRLLGSALHRTHRHPRGFLKIIFSRAFIDIGRCLTRKGDFISKSFFRLLELPLKSNE